MDAIWYVVIVVMILTVFNTALVYVMLTKMKEVKEILADHKENIEALMIRANKVRDILHLKENG